MIVIARNFGQLGNRLILSANLIAAACHYDVPLWNPSFAAYAPYFRSTHADPWCRFPVQPLARRAPSALMRRMLYKSVYLTGRTLSHLRMTTFPLHVVRASPNRRCDLRGVDFARRVESRRPILVSGWGFDAGSLLSEHANAIRSFYRIQPEHERAVDRVVGETRRRGDYVVGVHIRHGDYANFQNGQYYYPIDQYAAAMRRIRERLSHRNVVFLVCGNVPLDRHDFGDLNVCFGTGHMIEDMYAFAATDALVGPPSTYTGWASYYGGVPLRWMHSADETFEVLDAPFGLTGDQKPKAFAA